MWLFLVGLACQEQDCGEVPTYEDWTQGFLRSKCQSCHSSEASNRYYAPESIYFDSYEDAIRHMDQIRSSVLERESMPPAGGVSEDEKILLEQWLNCPH